MSNQKFVYVTYIRTSPDELWEALTGSEFTRQYWMGHDVESDWKAGSSVKFTHAGKMILSGKILTSEKPEVLSYTWSMQAGEQMRDEKPSRVTFLLERLESNSELVKLTVTHDEFPENSTVFPSISNGWPMVLSSLKTLLETNRAIPFKGACG
jgi:uncharacterized protein YndB with AHSA1/START domain